MNTFIFAEPEEKKEIISILNQKGLMGNIYCGNTFEDVKGIIDKAPGENRFIASDRKAKNILGQIGLMKSNLFLWTKGTLVRYGDYKTVKLKQKEAEAFKELENKKRSLYNPDDLFKNKRINEIENDTKNANITILNEKWYSKVILALKNFFKRK